MLACWRWRKPVKKIYCQQTPSCELIFNAPLRWGWYIVYDIFSIFTENVSLIFWAFHDYRVCLFMPPLLTESSRNANLFNNVSKAYFWSRLIFVKFTIVTRKVHLTDTTTLTIIVRGIEKYGSISQQGTVVGRRKSASHKMYTLRRRKMSHRTLPPENVAKCRYLARCHFHAQTNSRLWITHREVALRVVEN